MNTFVEHDSLSELYDQMQGCVACDYAKTRTAVVISRGAYKIPVVLVGEAPGANEDVAGVPFVGQSGVMLERMLNAVGWASQELYVANAVRCRPPQNSTPKIKTVRKCAKLWLFNELRALTYNLRKPALIICLGLSSYKLFDSKATVSKSHGKINVFTVSYDDGRTEDYNVMLTYHPSACIRQNGMEVGTPKYFTWQDLITARKFVEETTIEPDAQPTPVPVEVGNLS